MAAKHKLLPDGFVPAPGKVFVKPLGDAEERTAGGIVIAQVAAKKHDKVVRGEVLACGAYADRQGNIHDNLPHWPIKPGTIVYHNNYAPFEFSAEVVQTNAYDIVGFAPKE